MDKPYNCSYIFVRRDSGKLGNFSKAELNFMLCNACEVKHIRPMEAWWYFSISVSDSYMIFDVKCLWSSYVPIPKDYLGQLCENFNLQLGIASTLKSMIMLHLCLIKWCTDKLMDGRTDRKKHTDGLLVTRKLLFFISCSRENKLLYIWFASLKIGFTTYVLHFWKWLWFSLVLNTWNSQM